MPVVQFLAARLVKWKDCCVQDCDSVSLHCLQEGDIWPNRTAEINIIFKPSEARLYQQTVYCDVTGDQRIAWADIILNAVVLTLCSQCLILTCIAFWHHITETSAYLDNIFPCVHLSPSVVCHSRSLFVYLPENSFRHKLIHFL